MTNRKRNLRLGLGSLLLIVACAGAVLAWFRLTEIPRRALIQSIERLGGEVAYKAWSPKTPLRGTRVETVVLKPSAFEEIAPENLLIFPSLKELYVRNVEGDESVGGFSARGFLIVKRENLKGATNAIPPIADVKEIKFLGSQRRSDPNQP